MQQPSVQIINIMNDFAVRTGLSDSSQKSQRYLWTDAFAVCNFLELYRMTGKTAWLDMALKLVDQVHFVLGKYRKDSEQHGWLSGLDDKTARQHPTRGGLRIGKQLKERQPNEQYVHALEWDRDGQYFHYLTKWTHTLHCVSLITRQPVYYQWARELMRIAYAAFSYTDPTGTKSMYWKMSIDLSRPLVNSMGQHDPLDGLLMSMELEANIAVFPETSSAKSLNKEINDLNQICSGMTWATKDALGIGGLLTDAYRVVQLIVKGHLHETTLLELILNDISISLRAFLHEEPFKVPDKYRLAFRELGLAIGLQTIKIMYDRIHQNPEKFRNVDHMKTVLKQLRPFIPLYQQINQFWLEKAHQVTHSWTAHEDINSVMLATSLSPDSYLQN